MSLDSENSTDGAVMNLEQLEKFVLLTKRPDPWASIRLADRLVLEVEEALAKCPALEFEQNHEAFHQAKSVYVDNLVEFANANPSFRFAKHRSNLPHWLVEDVVERLEAVGLGGVEDVVEPRPAGGAPPTRYRFHISPWDGDAGTWPKFILDFGQAISSMRLDDYQSLNYLTSMIPQKHRDLIPSGLSFEEAIVLLRDGLDASGSIVQSHRKKMLSMDTSTNESLLRFYSFLLSIEAESSKLNYKSLLGQAGEVDSILRKLKGEEAKIAASKIVEARRKQVDDVSALLEFIKHRMPVLRLLYTNSEEDEGGRCQDEGQGGQGKAWHPPQLQVRALWRIWPQQANVSYARLNYPSHSAVS